MATNSDSGINVGLMGLGVVGGGVASALLRDPSPVAARVGCPVNLRRTLVRDVSRHRDVELPPGILTTNVEDLLDDPDIDILVEVMGGSDPATDYFRRAISAGKHVVTANKEVMAKDGAELMSLARAHRVSLLFEASVGGGIPIVGCLMNELAANDVYSIRTIINGTTNYILTRMAHQRTAFAEALAEAQGLGYAEADPTTTLRELTPHTSSRCWLPWPMAVVSDPRTFTGRASPHSNHRISDTPASSVTLSSRWRLPT